MIIKTKNCKNLLLGGNLYGESDPPITPTPICHYPSTTHQLFQRFSAPGSHSGTRESLLNLTDLPQVDLMV